MREKKPDKKRKSEANPEYERKREQAKRAG